jgi:hypothetical protein
MNCYEYKVLERRAVPPDATQPMRFRQGVRARLERLAYVCACNVAVVKATGWEQGQRAMFSGLAASAIAAES